MTRLHGTCVALSGTGVLLCGNSGAGKSDLALRLIDGGAVLVADDQVEIVRRGEGLMASAPQTIAGLIEVRGLGLFHLPFVEARLALVIDLVAAQAVERLPEEDGIDLMGVRLPRWSLNPWEVSAAAKVRLAVKAATGTIMPLR